MIWSWVKSGQREKTRKRGKWKEESITVKKIIYREGTIQILLTTAKVSNSLPNSIIL